MDHTPPANQLDAEPAPPIACAIDRSCDSGSGCGCGSATPNASQRRGRRAALVGVACVLGCLAVPIAIGGSAAVGGALAGEAWVIVAGAALAAVVALVLKRRRGSVC